MVYRVEHWGIYLHVASLPAHSQIFIFKTDFSPQLGNKICDWPGDEAMNCPRTCPNKLTISEGLIRLHLDSTLLCALETSEQVFVLLLVVPSGGRSLGLSGISPLIGGSHGNTL